MKPSNVLVTMVDQKPVVKVIDFGVAKIVGDDDQLAFHTATGIVIGTPAYMSPEQAGANHEKVDTRSDIYSLGVIFYELLTGSHPFPEAQNKVKFQRPTPLAPSKQLSSGTTDSGKQTRTDRHYGSHTLEGDLDCIILKCLEEEPSRRYGSANELIADIDRHLRKEPILAAPQTSWYKIRKFVQRYRLAVSLVALLGVATILGIIGTSVGMIVAIRKSEHARREAQHATELKEEAIANEQKALTHAKIAKHGEDFFQTVFANIGRFNRTRQYRDLNPLFKSVLGKVAGSLDQASADSVEIQLSRRKSLARAYFGLNFLKEAKSQIDKAIELNRDSLADRRFDFELMFMRAMVHMRNGKVADAEEVLVNLSQSPILSDFQKANGNDYGFRLNVAIPDTLSQIKAEQGEYAEFQKYALDAIRESERFGKTSDLAIQSRRNYGIGLRRLGHMQRSIDEHKKLLSIEQEVYGEDDIRSIETMQQLAMMLIVEREFKEALEFSGQLMAFDEAQGTENVTHCVIHAMALTGNGQHDEAQEVIRPALSEVDDEEFTSDALEAYIKAMKQKFVGGQR